MAVDRNENGWKVYLGAMAGGGGNNKSQAQELLALSDPDFLVAIDFAKRLVENPIQFDEVAKYINKLHARAIRAGKNTAPIDLVALSVFNDMVLTFRRAGEEAPEKRKTALEEVLERLVSLPGFYLFDYD